MDYETLEYHTPENFKGLYTNKSALIVSTGPSTKKLIKYKDIINKKFDVIIGTNYSILDFEQQLNFHVVMENWPKLLGNQLKKANYRRDLPRVINYIALRFLPKDINVVKATRCNFNHKPNLFEYKTDDGEGLFEGYTPVRNRGAYFGSVSLQSFHLACILGCTNIYFIGSECLTKKELHYYEDYKGKDIRDNMTNSAVRPPDIIKVQHNGKEYNSTPVYKLTADYINSLIIDQCRPNNIEVFDFSGGLLTEAEQLDIDVFMNK